MLFLKAAEGFLIDASLEKSTSTIRLYRGCLNLASKYLNNKEIAAVTLDDLKSFLSYLQSEYEPKRLACSTRKGQKLSDAAIDNYWKTLRSFFRWCFESKLTRRFTAQNLPRRKFEYTPTVPYTQEEMSRIVRAAEYFTTTRNDRKVQARRKTGKRNLALIVLLLDTGIRIGEASRMIISDVHMDTGEIFIRPFGTGRKTRSRTIPIGKRTRHALWAYLSSIADMDPSDKLFGMNVGSLRDLIIVIGTAAKVPHTRPHRFRHTFAIEYLRNGGDIFTLQRILGHSDLSMCTRYLAIIQTDLETAHKRASPVDRWKL